MTPKKVLVTGSSGYLGSQTVTALAQRPDLAVIALDVREPAARHRRCGL
jgi:nucleoside-diphosphate-sugar epimerase